MLKEIASLIGIEEAYKIKTYLQLKQNPKKELKEVSISSLVWGTTGMVFGLINDKLISLSCGKKHIYSKTYKLLAQILIQNIEQKNMLLAVYMPCKWMRQMFITEEFESLYQDEITIIEELRTLMANNNTKVIFYDKDKHPIFVQKISDNLIERGFPITRSKRTQISALINSLPADVSEPEDYRCLTPEKRKNLLSFLMKCTS